MAIAGLVIGAILSFITSWYFFRKSINKRLSAYLQFSSQVLAPIKDRAVREGLEIRYRGTKIDDLLQVQFVIANDGQRAIRDLIEPLSLELPKKVKLLEASILHVEPKGREVEIATSELPDGSSKIHFKFNLLNSGEYFFIRLLLNGTINAEKLKFSISVDDLPPTITPKPQAYAGNAEPPEVGVPAILIGLFPLSALIGLIYVATSAVTANPAFFPGGVGFVWFSWQTGSMVTCMAIGIYLLAIAIRQIVARGVFGSRYRFHIPTSTSRDSFGGSYWFGSAEDQKFEVLHRLGALPAHERQLFIRRLRMHTERSAPSGLRSKGVDKS